MQHEGPGGGSPRRAQKSVVRPPFTRLNVIGPVALVAEVKEGAALGVDVSVAEAALIAGGMAAYATEGQARTGKLLAQADVERDLMACRARRKMAQASRQAGQVSHR